jgi:endoribonuclease L-PSP, putative
MAREIIQTHKAPKAIGTYSQGVRAGNWLYISGQIPLLPESMELVQGDIGTQVHQVFKNLRAVAVAGNASLADVVKLTVYLTDLSHFPTVNEVMGEYFEVPYPARAAVGVVALPRGAAVEIDAVLYRGSAGERLRE